MILLRFSGTRNQIFGIDERWHFFAGGWSGWIEPVKKSEANKTNDEANVGNESSDEGDEDEEVGAESDEDEATLLSKLGLSSVDAGKELEATDPGVWLRWAAEERKRSWEQWLPTRGNVSC